MMTIIQPSGVQWVLSLLQLKLENVCDIFTPRVQPQEISVFFMVIYVDGRSESSSTYDMIIVQERALLGELGIYHELQ
jgi:hypothetical protein